jgi:hypothetical protein
MNGIEQQAMPIQALSFLHVQGILNNIHVMVNILDKLYHSSGAGIKLTQYNKI